MKSLGVAMVLALLLAACGSEAGPAGPRGEQGKQGAIGPAGDGAGGQDGATTSGGTGGAVVDAGGCDAACCADEDCPAPVNGCHAAVCAGGACAEVLRPTGYPCSTPTCGEDGGACVGICGAGYCSHPVRCQVGAAVYSCDGIHAGPAATVAFETINGDPLSCHTNAGAQEFCPVGSACTVKPDGGGAPSAGVCL